MVGCVFAMNREYFFHIGAFDEGMGVWGGENVELPLRVRYVFCSFYPAHSSYSFNNKHQNSELTKLFDPIMTSDDIKTEQQKLEYIYILQFSTLVLISLSIL